VADVQPDGDAHAGHSHGGGMDGMM
jgi:hypothetical protein